MKTLRMLVAAIVAFCVMAIAIMFGASDNVAVTSGFVTAMGVALLLGVFDERAKGKHTSIKDAARDIQQAA